MYSGSPGATHDQSVGLVAGACLGGGTVVNFSTSFRTPDDVRAEWASHGVPAFAAEDYTASLDAVNMRLGVNQEHNDPSKREQLLRDACIKLGWHVDAMPRNVTGALRPGQRLRLLRLRLPPRREAVDGEDMAEGRAGHAGADRRRGGGRARHGRGRRGARRRGRHRRRPSR